METQFKKDLSKVQQFGDTRSILISALEETPTFIECLFDEFKETSNITETNIYKQFVDIEILTFDLMKTLANTERTAEIIINRIDELHPDIKEAVLNVLINEKENIYQTIKNLLPVLNKGSVLNKNSVPDRVTKPQDEKDNWDVEKIVFNNKLIEYKNTLPKETDKKIYKGIAESLNQYIKGANDSDLSYIIEYKKLPNESKFEWIGKPADAVRFREVTELTRPEFNECFTLKDGKKLTHQNKTKDAYKDKVGNSEITNILKGILKK